MFYANDAAQNWKKETTTKKNNKYESHYPIHSMTPIFMGVVGVHRTVGGFCLLNVQSCCGS